MRREDTNGIILSASGLCALMLLLAIGCTTVTPTRTAETPSGSAEASPTSVPTPTRALRPTPAPCCASPNHLPPICGIVPGQSTTEDVEQVLGRPPVDETVRVDDGRDIPAGMDVDRWWDYTFECPVGLGFSHGVVSVVSYSLREAIPLEEVVAVYGPPEKVQWIWIDETGNYCCVTFLWPDEGMVAEAVLLPHIEEIPESIPFQADLPVYVVDYFQPTDLQQVIGRFNEGVPLFDWPGMTP